MTGNLRESVAAIIINKDKKVLMGEHPWIDDAWQLPQGGVEEGETEEQAILREIKEELGTDKLKILGKMNEKLIYKLPYYVKKKHTPLEGYKQTFFLIYYHGDESDIRFDNQEKPEFKAYQWVGYNEPPIRVIYFKKISYLKATEFFKNQVEKLDTNKIEI